MKNSKLHFDVIILGGGASGLFCANHFKNSNLRVALLEHNDTLGKKIIISGGGRCNFTNLQTTHQNFYSQNPHFCKSALAQFTPHQFLKLIQGADIPYVHKKKDQLFCQNSAKDILYFLQDPLTKTRHIVIHTGITVSHVKKDSQHFMLETSRGLMTSDSLIVATGGLSFPKLGASDLGYRIAKHFEHDIIAPRPALDGFRGSPFSEAHELAGVSLPVKITLKNKKIFLDDVLLTHHGLSGPSALQASLYWNNKEELKIDWIPQLPDSFFLLQKRDGCKKFPATLLQETLPSRLISALSTVLKIPQRPLIDIADNTLMELERQLRNFIYTPIDTMGYHKAEVTKGGVSTEHIDSKTMMSKKVPQLYFIGEVLDVTGELGGYNFQWAWSSASVCAHSILTRKK